MFLATERPHRSGATAALASAMYRRRRLVEVVDQLVDFGATDRIDFKAARLCLFDEFEVVQRFLECPAQRLGAVERNAGRRGEWARHVLAGQHELGPRLLGVGLGEFHDARPTRQIGGFSSTRVGPRR